MAEKDTSWTLEEETAFEDLMREGGLTRIQAIHLYKRMGRDVEKALKFLRESDE